MIFSPNQDCGSHDCIILFTDGKFNKDITDTASIVEEYSLRMEEYKRKGRRNNVQLAAITTDVHESVTLSQVTRFL